jgi:AcrR family transcriptional regulator
MPKLWSETINAHREEVREAIVDTTADLVTRHGLLSVTMSQIAEETGIGRATLYKYFPDVESILLAWHGRQISDHLDHLVTVRDHAGRPHEKLRAVLEAYALICRDSHSHQDAELAAFLHRDDQVSEAEGRLREMVQDLLTKAAATGHVRADVAPAELADFCLHALAASRGVPSKAAIGRLVEVTLAGMRPPS